MSGKIGQTVCHHIDHIAGCQHADFDSFHIEVGQHSFYLLGNDVYRNRVNSGYGFGVLGGDRSDDTGAIDA